MERIVITPPEGPPRKTEADPGRTLAQAIFLLGLWGNVPLCSGLGKCGLCRVRFVRAAPDARREEIARLGQEAVAQGWRLACLHPALPCEIELPRPSRAARPRREGSLASSGENALAVDLGTTTLHWAVLQDGSVTLSGSELNAQIGLGSEVMARLAFALRPGGAESLRGLILDQLKYLAASLNLPLEALCVAGNPAMLALLLGREPSRLAFAPYALPLQGGRSEQLDPALPAAYLPPLYAPFVGADLSAGLAALTLDPDERPEYPFLLADLGTNGEFILALSPSEALCASVPMGPALEGVGLRCGRTAGPGAITGFTLGPAGPAPQYFENDPDGPPGITGTGHLSLVALLLRAGLLQPDGRFRQDADNSPGNPLLKRLAARLTTEQGEPAFRVNDELTLPASDVEQILKVKAAFNLAFSRLLAEAGLDAKDLAALHLAGAMGEHVSLADLETLGFLPPGLAARTRKQGNTSLRGAILLLRSPQTRPALEAMAPPRLVDLAADPDLGSHFMQRMVFSHVR
ncbi:MAG: ASKHA domain-containing protein [Desulfovibrio sp.]